MILLILISTLENQLLIVNIIKIIYTFVSFNAAPMGILFAVAVSETNSE